MYLHVGNSKNIKLSDIVGIFDTDTATIGKGKKHRLFFTAVGKNTLPKGRGYSLIRNMYERKRKTWRKTTAPETTYMRMVKFKS